MPEQSVNKKLYLLIYSFISFFFNLENLQIWYIFKVVEWNIIKMIFKQSSQDQCIHDNE